MSHRQLMDFLPHTPLGWAAIGLAWCIVAVAIAPRLGKRLAVNHAPPPPPAAADPAALQPSNDWMNLVPSDSLRDDDPLLRERFEALMGSEHWSFQ